MGAIGNHEGLNGKNRSAGLQPEKNKNAHGKNGRASGMSSTASSMQTVATESNRNGIGVVEGQGVDIGGGVIHCSRKLANLCPPSGG